MTQRVQGNRWLPGIALCVGTLSIAACQKTPDTPPPPVPSSSSAPAPAQSAAQAYVPPTAEQLYQLVAPIALFPDKLVAQTLAASAYPDQVTAAQAWMQQNRQLAPAALIDAANAQPWDPSVKSLTAFPNVVDQLARNIDWTTTLGDAYVNDPTDVLNAIQVMRQRAQSHGNLASSAQQKVVVRDRSGDDASVFDGDNEPVVYSGPAVVPAPARTIVIEPEQDDTVYVPSYDPGVVYGDDVTIYRGYDYRPEPRYSTGQVVTAGLVSFGVGVLVGEAFSHHNDHDRRDWGWHAWNMNWGGGRDRGPGRPAVVYNDHPYVSHSTTVINRVTNNTAINRIDNRHDFNNGNRNITDNRTFNNDNRNVTINRAPDAVPPLAAQARPAPDFAHLQRPSFTERMTRPNQPVPVAPQERPGGRDIGGDHGRPMPPNVQQAGASSRNEPGRFTPPGSRGPDMAASPAREGRDPRGFPSQGGRQAPVSQQAAEAVNPHVQAQEREQQRAEQQQQRDVQQRSEQQQRDAQQRAGQERDEQQRAQQQQRDNQQRGLQDQRMQQEHAEQQQRAQQQQQQRSEQQQQRSEQQQQRSQQMQQQRMQEQQQRAEAQQRREAAPRPQQEARPQQHQQQERREAPRPHDDKKDDHN